MKHCNHKPCPEERCDDCIYHCKYGLDPTWYDFDEDEVILVKPKRRKKK
jgi:hypothetical protein